MAGRIVGGADAFSVAVEIAPCVPGAGGRPLGGPLTARGQLEEEIDVPGFGPSAVTLAGVLALGACTVAPPTGPSVAALPTEGKDFARFRQEDAACRQYAQQAIGSGSPQQAANQSALGSAAIGTALGAVVGGLIGSVSGDFGTGAAIGAGGGLLAGSGVGAGTAQTSAAALQRRYDVAYVQCMYASGNRVPTWGYPYGPYAFSTYPDSYYGPYVGGPTVSLGFATGRWHRW